MKNFIAKTSPFFILIFIQWLTIQFSEGSKKTFIRCHPKLNSMTCLHTISKKGFNFSEIPDAAKTLRIDCKHQLINFLPPDGFMNLKNLSNLIIVNCPSLRLKRDKLFLPLQNLKYLVLKRNALTGDIFKEVKHLNLLIALVDLSFNEIKALDFEFGIFPNLRMLILEVNAIQNISSNSFKNCYRLEEIYLSHNSISTLVNENEFGNFTYIFHSEYLPNLKALYLDDNSIHSMDCTMVPQTVEILSIKHNPIHAFSCDEPHLRNRMLQELDADWSLVDNSTTCFPPSLEILSLVNVKLSRLPAKLFSTLGNCKMPKLKGSHSFVVERFLSPSYNILYFALRIYMNVNCNELPLPIVLAKEQTYYCYNPPMQRIKTILVHNNNSTVFCQFIRMCSFLQMEHCLRRHEDDFYSLSSITDRIVDCGNLMLTEVPSILPKNSVKLFLDGNNLNSVNLQQILDDFPYLQALYLNKSNIHEITLKNLNNSYKSLQKLHLQNNFLNFFPVKFLNDFRNLNSLHLANNSLTKFHIVHSLRLNDLHLEYNNISTFSIEENVTHSITNVYLQHNRISKIEKRFCIYSFEILYLDNNEITEVRLNCRNSQNVKLKKLFLRNNYLTVLKPFSFSSLLKLEELHLEGNMIEHLEQNCFHYLYKLKRLYVQRNKLKVIEKEMLPSKYTEEADYYMFKLYKQDFYEVKTKEGDLNFTKFDKRTALSSDEFYIKENSFDIDFGGNSIERIDLSVFNVYPFLVSIHLNNNNLHEITCNNPLSLPLLKEIHLEENRLTRLSGEVFKGLTKVTKLYLHHNDLVFINKDTFKDMTSLEIVTLHGNKFQRLEILQFGFSSNFKQLTVHENPISCDCKYLDELRDILKKVSFISNVSQVKCLSKENNYLLEDYLFQFCDNKEIIIGLSVFIGILLFTVTISVLLYRYRLEIQVILYSRFKVRFFHDQSVDERKPFHAFIAYSCDDGEFVANQLLPGLEEYRLCLHDRNFVVGAFIQENIVNAVNYSACTVIVFSRSFVKSPWCRFEFRTAHDKSLSKGCRPIIVIVLEDVPPDDLEEEMKVYLRTSTYLRWGDQLFWEKLYFVLPALIVNDNERNNQQAVPLQEFNR